MRRWLASKRMPYWPFGAYILAYVQRVIGFRFDDIAPCNTIARCLARFCSCMVGRRNRAGRRGPADLRCAGSEAVELLLVPGSHDDYGEIGRQFAAVRDFLDRAFAGPRDVGFR